MDNGITVGQGLIFSLLGIAVVFFMLVLLMVVIYAISAVLRGLNNKKAPEVTAPVATPVPVAAPAATGKVPASGSLGDVKLFSVPDRTAAMIMAIVADETGEELNTLRFISIKQIG